MRMLRRTLAVAGLAVALAAGVAGCAGSVPKDDVATTIGSKLTEEGVSAGQVTCPEDLEAEVGKVVRCEFLVDGQPVDAVATVTSVQGDQANFDITTEARPVAKAVLDEKVGEQVAQQLGVAIDSTDCSGDLQPQVNDSVTCTVTGGGETLDLLVTVTGVEGGLINYSIEQA